MAVQDSIIQLYSRGPTKGGSMRRKFEYRLDMQLPLAANREITDLARCRLFCLPEQQQAWMAGYNVYHGLAKQRVLGDVALEQCLAEPDRLPRQWREFEICFWGCLLQAGRGRVGIRTMYWNRVSWTAGFRFTDSFFTRHQPALVIDEPANP